jgi:hypothetical protein
MNGQDIVWAPQAGSQEAFLSCPLYEVLYEGTRGPGKTDALLMDFCPGRGQGLQERVAGHPVPPDVPRALRRGEQVEEVVPPHLAACTVQREQDAWRFPEGEELMFRHFRVPDDYYSYHGHAYPWIAWEELTTWPDDKCYTVMMSCSRSTKKGMPRKYRATTNPYGVGHNWVKAFPPPAAAETHRRPDRQRGGRGRQAAAAARGHSRPPVREPDPAHLGPHYVDKIKAAARNSQRARRLAGRQLGDRGGRHVRRLLGGKPARGPADLYANQIPPAGRSSARTTMASPAPSASAGGRSPTESRSRSLSDSSRQDVADRHHQGRQHPHHEWYGCRGTLPTRASA